MEMVNRAVLSAAKIMSRLFKGDAVYILCMGHRFETYMMPTPASNPLTPAPATCLPGRTECAPTALLCHSGQFTGSSAHPGSTDLAPGEGLYRFGAPCARTFCRPLPLRQVQPVAALLPRPRLRPFEQLLSLRRDRIHFVAPADGSRAVPVCDYPVAVLGALRGA